MALLEGLSFLVLLFIAMPLKYIFSLPEFVKYVGWTHGVLFIAYQVFLISAMIDLQWKIKKAVICFIASLIPFGTFIIDKDLRKEESAFLQKTS